MHKNHKRGRRKTDKKNKRFDVYVDLSILLIFIGLLFLFAPGLIYFAPPNAIEVGDCQDLDIDGAYYVLNQDIVALGTCLNVVADNIVIDGNGYSLTGPLGGVTEGVYVNAVNNVSVIHMNISMFDRAVTVFSADSTYIFNNTIRNTTATGILLQSSTNSLVIENNLSTNMQEGIFLTGGSIDNVVVANDILYSQQHGVLISESSANLIVNNSIDSNGGAGILFNNADFNQVVQNSIDNNGFLVSGSSGIELSVNSDNNNFIGNSVNITAQNGIIVADSKNNVFSNMVIVSPVADGILLDGSGTINTTLDNVSVLGIDQVLNYDIKFDNVGDDTRLANTHLGSYFITGSAAVIIFEDTGEGEIKFLEPIEQGIGKNLTEDVRIEYNFVFVNGTAIVNGGLNKVANVTLYNLPTNLQNMSLLRDGIECAPEVCFNFTALNEGTVVFNVSGWTNYTVFGEDLAVPFVTINVPENITYNSFDFPLILNVTVNEISNIWYTLDDGATNVTMDTFDGFNFNYSLGFLADGSYIFDVFVNDSSGNINGTEFVLFGVNTSESDSPLVTISQPQNLTYGSGNLPLFFQVELNENGTANYSLDGGENNVSMFGNQGGVFGTIFTGSNSSIADGQYIFSIYSTDIFGNRNDTEFVLFAFNGSEFGVEEEEDAPLVTINSPANITYDPGSLPLLFNVSLDKIGEVRYSLDAGVNNVSMTTSDDINFVGQNGSLAEGSYTFTVYANDSFGKINETEFVVFSFSEVDITPPQVSINFPRNTTYTDDKLPQDFSVTLNENGSVSYSLSDGVVNVTMNTIDNINFVSTNSSIGDGNYTFSVYAVDLLGNINGSELVMFEVDESLPPSVTVNVPQPIDYDTDDLPLIFEVVLGEEGDTVFYNLDNGANRSMQSSDNITYYDSSGTLNTIEYLFRVFVNDTSGNRNDSASVVFEVFEVSSDSSSDDGGISSGTVTTGTTTTTGSDDSGTDDDTSTTTTGGNDGSTTVEEIPPDSDGLSGSLASYVSYGLVIAIILILIIIFVIWLMKMIKKRNRDKAAVKNPYKLS
jgi:parallel beta-helix repeat protein